MRRVGTRLDLLHHMQNETTFDQCNFVTPTAPSSLASRNSCKINEQSRLGKETSESGSRWVHTWGTMGC